MTKNVIFKNFAPFTDCINEIINKEIYEDIYVVMPMYNLTEYTDSCSKQLFEILRQYYGDEPCIDDNCVIIDIIDDSGNASFK